MLVGRSRAPRRSVHCVIAAALPATLAVVMTRPYMHSARRWPLGRCSQCHPAAADVNMLTSAAAGCAVHMIARERRREQSSNADRCSLPERSACLACGRELSSQPQVFESVEKYGCMSSVRLRCEAEERCGALP